MRTRGLLFTFLCGSVLASALALAPAAGAVVVKAANGHYYGVYLRPGENPTAYPGSIASKHKKELLSGDDGMVTYQGGPVIHTSAPYLVFWGPTGSFAASDETVFENYLSDLAGAKAHPTDTAGVIRQYYDTTGYAGQSETFNPSTQVLTDTDAFPTLDTDTCETPVAPVTHCVTDAQIQTELTNYIAAHDLPTGTGANAPIYFVVTPTTVNICEGGTCAIDQNDGFCAYHGSFTDATATVLYASIPMIESIKDCQQDGLTYFQSPNDSIADNAVDNLSHENEETITDPLFDGPYAWTDPISGNEVADNCTNYAATADPAGGYNPNAYEPVLGGVPDGGPPLGDTSQSGTYYDQVIDGGHFYTQTVWSNGDGTCEAQPVAAAAPTVTAASPDAPGANMTFSAPQISSGTWSFGDGSASQFIPTADGVSHTYAQQGDYTVTVNYVDLHGNTGSATVRVAVGRSPTAAITAKPSSAIAGVPVAFSGTRSSDPNAGGAITAYGWSFGDGASSATASPTHKYSRAGHFSVTLTVTDRLGIGASASATLAVTIAKITRISAKGKQLVVSVDGPGTIVLGSHRDKVAKAGTYKLAAPLSNAQKRTLSQQRRVAVTFKLSFVPIVGPTQHVSRRLTVRG